MKELSVLVVDDDDKLRDLLPLMLEPVGHTVTCARDGAEAVRMLDRQNFDLVITDIMMPRMSGTELAAHLRTQEQTDVPIILMSAVRSPIAIPNTIYLPKPFDIEHVLELVTLLLPA